MVKFYLIEGKTYTQRPLVLGQLQALIATLNYLKATEGPIFEKIMENAPQVLSVVLIPDGMHPSEVDRNALASELSWVMTMDQTMEVIADFFDCNDLLSLFGKIEEMMKEVSLAIQLKNSFASSPPATSPSDAASSGE